MRTIEAPHSGDCPVCLAEVHPDAKVCIACGAEKIFVNDGDGMESRLVRNGGVLLVFAALPAGCIATGGPGGQTQGEGILLGLAMAGLGLFLARVGLRMARANWRRTSREAWERASAADVVDAAERAATSR